MLRRGLSALSALLVPLFAVAACGGGGMPGIKVSGTFGTRPDVTFPKGSPGGSFAERTLVEGKGAKVAAGDLVVADFSGYRWNTGGTKLLASSYAGSSPTAFPSERLIPGLTKALVGRRAGSRVLAVIPPKDGYGGQGDAAQQITAGDSLVYVLDIRATFPRTAAATGQARPLSEAALPQVGTAAAGQAPPVAIPHTAAPTTPQSRTVVQGQGPAVKSGQLLVVQYAGYLWRTGRSFDSSYGGGHVFSTVIGAQQVVKGWDEGLVGRHVGSRVLLVLPPQWGYGTAGLTQSGIKGTDTLVYTVDILGAY